ncbi:MAG TPA: beta-propeller domain-containing protein [Sporichthyaceae bacterium]|nr:beta-propeller domain-containing protein [Sporichthyaceae bacterium]
MLALAVTLTLPAVPAHAATGAVQTGGGDDLSGFKDCRAFTNYMRSVAEPEVGAYGFGGGPMLYRRGGPMTNDTAAPQEKSGAPGEAVGNGATGTNVQERDVDEPDVAKVDGNRVLTLTGGKLNVVDTSGRKPVLRGSLAFTDSGSYPSEMLVLPGHRALVISSGWSQVQPYAVEDGPARKFIVRPGPQGNEQLVLTLVDVSGKPTVLRTDKITGHYISARLHDGSVRVVLGSQPRIAFSQPGPNEPEATATARNQAAVRTAKATDFLPARQILDAAGKVTSDGPLLGCTDVRRPYRPSGLGIISVLTLDTTTGDAQFTRATGTGVVGNGELVYASANRLYVATTEGGWQPHPEMAARPVPEVGTRPAQPDERRTAIHAFDVTGRAVSRYLGSGAVPGYLLGRWAFSEQDGYLRVATTTGQPWATQEGQTSQSSVVVLAERPNGLRWVSVLSGLGQGETIRAVRWFGDLAAVVTFRQTDPLYLVDLSDPARPRLRGELKTPGFSAYLHPTGDGGLLGVGHSADEQGRITGLQAQQFNIANPAKPTRTDVLALGQGWTSVESDSRAFTYLTASRLAVIPAWINKKVSCPPNAQCMTANGGGQGFVGEINVPAAIGITVDRNGTLHRSGEFIGDSSIIRVIPVGNLLAAITDTSVVLLNPDGLKAIASVRVAPEQHPVR